MAGLTDAVRHLRPVPDLGALVRLALSQVEPSLDVDGPVAVNLHRDARGAWHMTALLTLRAAAAGPGGDDAAPLRWSLRRTRRFAVHLARLAPTVAVVTDAPTFAEAQLPWLREEVTRLTSAASAAGAGAPEGRLEVRARPAAFAPDGSAEADAGPEAMAALSTWMAPFEVAELGLRFSPIGLSATFRARPGAGTPAEASLGALAGPVLPAARTPANAALVVVGDARRSAAPLVKPLVRGFDLLELLEAATPGPTGPGAGATEALGPLLDAVEGDYVWSLQSGPGSGRATLFLNAALDTLPESLDALPVVYALDGRPVRRLGGFGPFMPADIYQTEHRLLVAAGGAQRSLLEGIVSGRLTTRASMEPPSESVIFRAAGDLDALLRLFGVEMPIRADRVAAEPLHYVVETDGQEFGVDFQVPYVQVDGVADLLRRKADLDLPEGGNDWLFPEGI